jgi:hypothetical protein
MVQSATQQPPPFVEDVTVKDAFSDFCIGISLVGTNLHMTFGSVTADHTKPTAPPTRVVCARLVLALPGAVELRDLLAQIIDSAAKQGLIRAAPVPTIVPPPGGTSH